LQRDSLLRDATHLKKLEEIKATAAAAAAAAAVAAATEATKMRSDFEVHIAMLNAAIQSRQAAAFMFFASLLLVHLHLAQRFDYRRMPESDPETGAEAPRASERLQRGRSRERRLE
jgi:hypothetical protein